LGIERLAADQLTRQGGCAWHVENRLPLGLAGLLYWPAVFAPVPGTFTNAYQRGPLDLFWADFAATRAQQLTDVERRLACDAGLVAVLRQTRQAKSGTDNALVSWGLWQPAFIDCLLRCVPLDSLRRLAAFVIRNLAWARTGFPDLLLCYGPGCFELVEVKGPGDQLQRTQNAWLRRLDELGLPRRVLRYRLR
jgi:hypothetical protein